MRFLRAALLGLILAGGNAVTAHADDASRLALAREAVVAAHATDLARKLIPTLFNQLRPLMLKQGGSPQAVDDYIARGMAKMNPQIDRLADLIAELYAREFSEEDLSALVAFYKSPAGQHLIEKQPAIAQFMVTVGASWGEQVGREIVEEYRREQTGKTAQP